eukprot:CAMPEP_0172362358 /NCGR_PEP_ID=MMETSP1060-20121228/5983_1 /TAXON_ID=37318 /ORGANISM="Pseudo-nitzschia pungens, Strain cf. cingulata" /LENGTH=1094 /DNA_ID=CAMNT_0013084849 /DNA_START=556 /DNA_END=3840 /DNA_ORIENTATION=-
MSYCQQDSRQLQQQRVKVVAGYALHQRLGSGSFATVYKGIRVEQRKKQQLEQEQTTAMCDEDENDDSSASSSSTERQDRLHPQLVAIKAIARTSEKLTKKVLQNLEIEISILRTYRHPNIVCMHDVQKTDRHFYLLLEYCGGGDVQHLIRSRQKGRLSERLTRRLMRDLSSGLRFLWSQELIHRDIKPQNLLLTGPLPVEELAENPPKENASGLLQQSARSIYDDPNPGFSLKIADFGFARHLQTASMAETLCGSPLYMAPEILQHHRYDAKADLWSVGTVLFEMIAGRPPYNGENHIDLLRNIQHKAVRLPPDVRVSKPCVNLLRILLNRNPLSRAGFKEFFEACDAFVALGCGGVATGDHEGGLGGTKSFTGGNVSSSSNSVGGGIVGGGNRIATKDLGTIHENDQVGTNTASTDSLMTVETTSERDQQQPVATNAPTAMVTASTSKTKQQMLHPLHPPNTNVVSPNLAPSAAPCSAALIPNSINLGNNDSNSNVTIRQQAMYQQPNGRNRLTPLQSSPPTSTGIFYLSNKVPAPLPSPTGPQNVAHKQSQQQPNTGYYSNSGQGLVHTHTSSNSQSQVSVNSDSGFVMVEHAKSPTSSQHFYVTGSQQQQQQHRNSGIVNNEVAEKRANASKGMLSTSPGTGKLLLGMVNRATIGFGVGSGSNSNSSKNNIPSSLLSSNKQHEQTEHTTRMNKLADEIAVANKMIATAEDIGRRAVSVAHLGDTRAYLGMRLILRSNEEGSSLLSTTQMEGVEEEPATCAASANSADNMYDVSTDNSSSTEIMAPARRRPPKCNSTEKPMSTDTAEEEEEEMPFAISPDAPSVSIPSRSNPSVYNRGSSISSIKKSSTMKPNPQSIRTRFSEALSCYLKSLKMLKGAVGAAQKVTKDLKDIEVQLGGQNLNCQNSKTASDFPRMKQRCEITSHWLCSQFSGVLERADAANVEISKLLASGSNGGQREGQQETTNAICVEELIYNHALASGRDGAVKHLLGQYEAARSCYRTAGLLAETLIMEVDIGSDDRKILEGYVDGFAARITELDQLMLQQSRMTISSNTSQTSQSQQSRRGSGVVGLIGPPPVPAAAAGAFLVGSPR